VLVRTHLRNVRESLVHFGYELVRVNDGTLLAEGETTHIVVDLQMKVRAIPDKYMNVFQEAVGRKT
jgi:acyl-CoA thioester hydrolase